MIPIGIVIVIMFPIAIVAGILGWLLSHYFASMYIRDLETELKMYEDMVDKSPLLRIANNFRTIEQQQELFDQYQKDKKE